MTPIITSPLDDENDYDDGVGDDDDRNDVGDYDDEDNDYGDENDNRWKSKSGSYLSCI